MRVYKCVKESLYIYSHISPVSNTEGMEKRVYYESIYILS